MHYSVKRLNKALLSDEVELARRIAATNLTYFRTVHPILFPNDDVTDMQVRIMKRLAKNQRTFYSASIKCHLSPSIIQWYTSALLMSEYDEEMDRAMAEAVDCVTIKEIWTETQIFEFNWDLKFHFHRAIFGHVLIASEEVAWEGKGDFLRKVADAAPEEMPIIMAKALIGRAMRNWSIGNLLNLVGAALFGKTPHSNCGDTFVDLIVELLCGSSARPFEEYLAMDPLQIPVYIHHVVGLIGVRCLERNEDFSTESVRDAVSKMIAKDEKTFTKFIFTLYGPIEDYQFVRKYYLDLIDYSMPEWNEPFGRELHLAIFYPNDKETTGDIAHLFLKAPKHLAVDALRKSNILTLDLVESFPQDRILGFLNEGALHNLIFEGSHHAVIYKNRCKQVRIEGRDELPDWLIVKDTDDARMTSIKGLIRRQVHAKKMTFALWEDLVPENVRKDLKKFIGREIIERNYAYILHKPDLYTATSIEESLVYKYYLELQTTNGSKGDKRESVITTNSDNNNNLFDAFMFTPSFPSYDSIWEETLWPAIPDHLWFDPAERESKSWTREHEHEHRWTMYVSKYKMCASRILPRLVSSAYYCVLKYPNQKYSVRMHMILDKVDRLLREKSSPGW